jgi:hypothetical protein
MIIAAPPYPSALEGTLAKEEYEAIFTEVCDVHMDPEHGLMEY